MFKRSEFKNKLFSQEVESNFEDLALELFYYQAEHNPVYAQYLQALDKRPRAIISLLEIPFLPISFFKSHQIITGNKSARGSFSSSGTGGEQSQHYIQDLPLYVRSFETCFKGFYGDPKDYCFLALLPSYLEREGSSLIYMVNHFIELSADADSGFFLADFETLALTLKRKIAENKPTVLMGVSFALLDFAERYTLPENDLIVMETGGMKGRRKELVRSELHQILSGALGTKQIHSEYGMTELFSQAYAPKDGRFSAPPWMKIQIRDTDDPFSPSSLGKTGGMNIVDLANIDSCAFIETQDLGRLHQDGTFEVMGRFDNSDIRGCNLMIL